MSYLSAITIFHTAISFLSLGIGAIVILGLLGVVPLAVATGPGAEMRQALGTAVFFGMLGVTFFGLFLTPVFYVSIRILAERFGRPDAVAARASSPVGEPPH